MVLRGFENHPIHRLRLCDGGTVVSELGGDDEIDELGQNWAREMCASTSTGAGTERDRPSCDDFDENIHI